MSDRDPWYGLRRADRFRLRKRPITRTRSGLPPFALPGPCFYCGKIIGNHNATVDHYIPLSKGGSCHPENLVWACQPCNQAKGNKLPEEFKP